MFVLIWWKMANSILTPILASSLQTMWFLSGLIRHFFHSSLLSTYFLLCNMVEHKAVYTYTYCFRFSLVRSRIERKVLVLRRTNAINETFKSFDWIKERIRKDRKKNEKRKTEKTTTTTTWEMKIYLSIYKYILLRSCRNRYRKKRERENDIQIEETSKRS